MTVIGIAGCMGLLIVGFGLRDSIVDVATIQFNKIWHYQPLPFVLKISEYNGIVLFKPSSLRNVS
jgi:hypothetical protein